MANKEQTPVLPSGRDANAAPYSIYLLLCKGNVLYVGITNNIERRYRQHCCGKGAKFTRSHPPLALLSHVEVGTRSEALRLEYAVKQLRRSQKQSFFESYLPPKPAVAN